MVPANARKALSNADNKYLPFRFCLARRERGYQFELVRPWSLRTGIKTGIENMQFSGYSEGEFSEGFSIHSIVFDAAAWTASRTNSRTACGDSQLAAGRLSLMARKIA
jgi:hypothetical protein